jgi:hypothetical protein
MLRSVIRFVFFSALAASLTAADLEQPVGIMLSAGGSRVLRAGTETQLASKAGDLLFAGDELWARGRPSRPCRRGATFNC